ncbi:hypothetical protein E3U43_016033 [Larimichthys crocea]|uniref:Uncharacterized protein n=1 Tax=Larimichthys crocea TaxID=215358 RepID=A0ACD3QI98_LARCR|nr:hypothetical protein E3U43_016033 [Larimichthys crocea]
MPNVLSASVSVHSGEAAHTAGCHHRSGLLSCRIFGGLRYHPDLHDPPNPAGTTCAHVIFI